MMRPRRVVRRRMVGRAAVVGGAAYYAGKHRGRPDEEPEPEPSYAAAVAPPASHVEQLEQLAELRQQGILTEEEFTAEKTRILGS